MLQVSETLRVGADKHNVIVYEKRVVESKDGTIRTEWQASTFHGGVAQALASVNERWAKELISAPGIVGWADFIAEMQKRWDFLGVLNDVR